MEEDDKGCLMIRMGVSWWVFLLVPAYPGCPDQRPLNGCVCVCVCVSVTVCYPHYAVSVSCDYVFISLLWASIKVVEWITDKPVFDTKCISRLIVEYVERESTSWIIGCFFVQFVPNLFLPCLFDYCNCYDCCQFSFTDCRGQLITLGVHLCVQHDRRSMGPSQTGLRSMLPTPQKYSRIYHLIFAAKIALLIPEVHCASWKTSGYLAAEPWKNSIHIWAAGGNLLLIAWLLIEFWVTVLV